MYLGLSYEKIGDTAKALECYEEAASIDPEDLKIRELRDMLKAKLSSTSTVTEAQKTNMIDDEQGERISLPVNKKAINARIRDDEQ
jgi:tetratricopeptide (TPR) repeat protein